MHADPQGHVDFMKKRLGERRYDALVLRSNLPNRPDYKAIEIWLKEQINELENQGEEVLGKH